MPCGFDFVENNLQRKKMGHAAEEVGKLKIRNLSFLLLKLVEESQVEAA